MITKKKFFLSDIEFIIIDINILTTSSPTQDVKDDAGHGGGDGGYEGSGNGDDEFDDG